MVDDDPATRELLITALELDGHPVVAVESGEEALEHLRRHPVGAVLLDRTMPGTDGLEVLRAIRADRDTSLVPVLLVTGVDDAHERVAGLDVGADDYVIKPFDPDEVVARVRAHLRGHRAWVDRLTATVEHRRAVLARAAEQAGSAATAREAAAALCQAVVSVPEVDGAQLVEVGATHRDVLGAAGIDGFRLVTLAERTDLVDDLARGLLRGPRVAELPDRIVFFVPVSAAGQTLGALIVTGDRAARGAAADALLALSIDFAALAGGVLAEPLRTSLVRARARRRVRAIVEDRSFTPVFQPVVRLADGAVVGHEALTRFDEHVEPERVFVDAARLGAGLELEEATLDAALDAAREQPQGLWLALNVTPTMILDETRLGHLLERADRAAVVLEISELEPVLDYRALLDAIDTLAVTVQLSVDDAGSGFASLAHILALDARYVKLDKSWVHGLDHDPAKRALVAGLQNFAMETGASLIAEGIETPAQLAATQSLGIAYGQGFLLGEPVAF